MDFKDPLVLSINSRGREKVFTFKAGWIRVYDKSGFGIFYEKND